MADVQALQQFDESQSLLSTSTSIEGDGRVSIRIRQRKRPFGLFRSKSKESTLSELTEGIPLVEIESDVESILAPPTPPRLNIVIQIVGSRGDVQPFIALGLTLRNKYSHRVRIATHAVFQDFVEENGLEFFNIGGNPEDLMAFMVRNPGLLPSYDSLKSGDVRQQRRNMYEILKGCWRSCIEPGNGLKGEDPATKPFVADAIIANPPSFAHIHCAEKLGIPLHLMFTMPYSPTEAFPHPLANIRRSDLGMRITNQLSYSLIEKLTWYGLGDLINKFRENTLSLSPLNLAWAAGMITRLKIPYTYCWSPTLLPKPRDWGSNISVSGFYFLSTTSNFRPPADLMEFIVSGEPPIYIGFGSIVVENSKAMTEMVLEAIQKAGVRALISEGWGSLGSYNIRLPDSVFILGNVPHSWLFEQVSAVVHHGGAGTTAAGLAAGKPTVVVPFFGDQFFWGEMIANTGTGPRPVPYSKQSAEKLASQIRQVLHPDVKLRARHIQMKLQEEKGCENGVRHFHRMLNTENSRCMVVPERPAVWLVKGRDVRLSAMVAAVLLERGILRTEELALYRQKEYTVKDLPTDPVTGGALAFLGSFIDVIHETYSLPRNVAKTISNPSRASPSHPIPIIIPTIPATATSRPPSYRTTDSPMPLAHTQEISINNQASINSRLEKCVDVAVTTATEIGKLSKVVLSAPMHFSMGIARGFQSIPVAYGDATVRSPEKVTGILTGIEVGSKELAYGFYDGITGVVTQPIRGAKANGAVGFVKGLSHGLGGLVLKPGAGLFGLPAYALQGVSQEFQNLLSTDYEKCIRWSRLVQGREEITDVEEEEKVDILRDWESVCEVQVAKLTAV